MQDDERSRSDSPAQDASSAPVTQRDLPAAARRALDEAAARRQSHENGAAAPEVGGRGGLEPARYGDWEVKGLASDF